MRQLTYIERGRLEWWDVAEPVLEAETDALVRPLAAARCDGDKLFLFRNVTTALEVAMALHYVDPMVGALFGQRPFKGPFPIGHECVAEVVDCGDAVKAWRKGDVVVVPWAISCGTCQLCRSKLTSKCLCSGKTYASAYGFGKATGSWGGMVSDLVRVPHAEHMLVRVPEGIDPVSVASASDNIPDGFRTVAPQLQRHPGAPVLVVGSAAASIGLYAAGIAVALGSEWVDYLDHDRERLKIATSLGAHPLEVPRERRSSGYRRRAIRAGGYPISVDASSHPDGLRFAIRSLSPGGTCTSVGYYFQSGTRLPLMQMYANCSTLHTGFSHPRADLPQVLELIRRRAFFPEKVTTVLAPWNDADQAFLAPGTKVIVHRPSLFLKPVRDAILPQKNT